jgi:hypothetical protein
MDTQTQINYLLADPERLLERKPFTRGADMDSMEKDFPGVYVGGRVRARLPKVKRNVVSQDQYIAELDPNMHTVLFDENIPSICVKFNDGSFQDRQFTKTAIPFQRSIMEKQTLHMASMPMKFTLSDKKPTDEMQEDFVTFKHYWDLRNQDGMKVKMVATAKSYGDAGLLFYLDRRGEIRSRLLSYADGYVICSHNDENGDRLLESVYYTVDNKEYIDSWDDKYMYRYELSEKGEWTLSRSVHGFNEIPLITKRTNVAWEGVQSLCDSYETLYNIFQVLQKKWGWGMLYVKGRIDPKAQKIAGNIVLNDVSIEGKGDAKFLEPPSPQNMIQTLDSIFDRIQIGSGTTFILPKDIHTSSDTSGIAVQMTQSLDIQTAKNGIVEWQNVADKMVRLFKHGLAMELRNKRILDNAVPRFEKLNINAQFDIWQPYSEEQYNAMLGTMVSQKILSRRTGTEANTISRPDECERLEIEKAEDMKLEVQKTERTKQIEEKYTNTTTNNTKSNE